MIVYGSAKGVDRILSLDYLYVILDTETISLIVKYAKMALMRKLRKNLLRKPRIIDE